MCFWLKGWLTMNKRICILTEEQKRQIEDFICFKEECGRTGSNGRYFKERMNELARKYRAEKKREKCLR